MTASTLLLNAGFEPLRIITWQKAFVLFFQEKVEVLERYDLVVRSVQTQHEVPAVVRLRRWVSLKRQAPAIRFCRANVYARDNYRCQYCHKHFSERELTLDHVIPVVRGGKKTWENIVTACLRCNQRKSDRTPEQVGTPLLQKPTVPRWLPGTFPGIFMGRKEPPEVWQPYLTPQHWHVTK